MVHVSYPPPVGNLKRSKSPSYHCLFEKSNPRCKQSLKRQKLPAKVNHSQFPHLSISDQSCPIHIFSHSSYHLQCFLPALTDADKQPADSLTKVAALDIDNLLIKMPGISKGILFNIWQVLLKEWGPDSLGVLQEDTMQELLTGITFNSSFLQFLTTHIHHFPTYPYLYSYFDHFHYISFPLLLGFKSIKTGCSLGGESSPTLT